MTKFCKVKQMTKKGMACLLSAVLTVSVIPETIGYADSEGGSTLPAIGDVTEVTTVENGEETTKDWKLVWSDEFEGTSLDTTKWGYMVGTGAEYSEDGWGNSECEYYTEGENLSFEDGHLVITAKKTGDDKEKYGNKAYTSTRLWTRGDGDEALFAKKYGRFEAAISLPEGTGYWPAFWMMPAYDEYGVWAASGEIDIMEARGRVTNSIDGTVHYGGTWPNDKLNGGTYTDDNLDITKEHVYALEWEPGEMRWYIDNELYYSSSTWYSIGDGNAENYTYGAPFDQEFYILLNMAVGGNYDSGQLDESIDGGQMKVDYVRVYDEVGEDGQVVDYDENVQPKTADVGDLLGGEVGENLTPSSLETISKVTTDYATEGTNGWDLLALEGFGGAADASYEDGAAKVTISNGGSQSYSVQLTHKLPLTYGYRYQISFKAKADQARTASIKVGQASGSFAAYTDTFTPSLTTEYKDFVYTFDMVSDSDEDCRIEFNMGQNTSSVYIKDVQLVSTGLTPVAGENDAKEPLTNGEHIYNGTFDQGNNVDANGIMTRLKYWKAENLTAKVDAITREVCLSDSIDGSGTLSQKGVNLLNNDEYLLQFDARADEESQCVVSLQSEDESIYSSNSAALTKEMKHYSYKFTMNEETDPLSELVFAPDGTAKNVYIDNVSLTRLTDNNVDYSNVKCYLIGNGSFEAGTSSFSTYQTNMGIDVMPEYNQLWVAAAPCQNNYDMMLLNTDLNFTAGMKYTMKFKAKTSSGDAQNVVIRIQREGGDWASVLDESFTVTNEWQDYEYQFTSALGESLNLKYLLGEVTAGCNMYFRDIELYVTSKPVKEAAYLYGGESTKAGQSVVVNYLDKDLWEECESITYYINDKAVDASDVVMNKEANTLTFNKSLFSEAGIYEIQAKADGFDISNIVSQTVLDSSGNVVVNGDFSDGTTGWGSYFTNGCGSFSVNDGQADVNFVWHEGQTWDLQLYQEGMELEGGVPYMVQFKAKSTIDRDMTVEFPTATAFQTVSLTGDYKTFTYFYTPAEDISAKINFLLGNINGLSNDNNSHTISFDDIVIRKATDEDIYGESPIITVDKVFYEDQDVIVSYTENPLWEQKEKEVYVNGVKADTISFDSESNTVTINASYFVVGKNEVKIVAEDYKDTDAVEVTVQGLDGEYIENGSFDNGGEGFGTWFAEGEETGSISFDGEAVATFKKPYYAWEQYVNYAIQLYQDNITVTSGKEYTLTFKAASTLDKNIYVEITGVDTKVEALTKEMKEYTITFVPTVSNIKVNFLLSESPDGEQTAAHTITLDDISLMESGYVVPSYKINYVVGEGNNAKDNPESYQYGTTVTLLAAEREGYTFDGWYLEDSYVNKVTAITPGEKGDITLYAKFTKVVPPIIEVEKVTLNKTSGTLLKGDTVQLKAVVTPSNATDQTVTFTTSNSKVATVTSKGLVTAVGEGTASITAKAGNVKAVYKVQVVVKPSKVKNVKVSNEKITSFRVSYSKASGATGYQVAVYRSNKRILIKSTKNTALTVSGLTSGTTYKVKVRAYKTVNGKTYYGELSNPVTFTTAPAKTKITSAKAYKSKGVRIQYKKISQATGYEIYMKKKGGTYKRVSVNKSSSKVAYTTTSLKKGETYYFKVRAYRKVGSKTVYGSFSNTVKFYCKK